MDYTQRRIAYRQELEQFKTNINLVEFAAREYGYKLRKEKSSVHRKVLESPSGDIILVARSKNNHWQFITANAGASFNPDSSDNGSIIDLVQKHEHLDLQGVRDKLRGETGSSLGAISDYEVEPKKEIDRSAIKQTLRKMSAVTDSPYLKSRGVSRDVLKNPIFLGSILNGYNEAVVFPHWDEQGLIGYEIRNTGFKGFSKQGGKGIWFSKNLKKADAIVFTESPIEALSHFQLKKPANTAYMSTSGNMSSKTVELMKRVFEKYPNIRVIASFNNDEKGRGYAKLVQGLRAGAQIEFPNKNDWNDELMSQLKSVQKLGETKAASRNLMSI